MIKSIEPKMQLRLPFSFRKTKATVMSVKMYSYFVMETFSSEYQEVRGPSSASACTSIANSQGLPHPQVNE